MSEWPSDIKTPNICFLYLGFLVYRQKWRLKFTLGNKGGHRKFFYNKFQNHRNEANYFLYKITIITIVRQLLSNKKNRRQPKNSEIELHSLFLFEKINNLEN